MKGKELIAKLESGVSNVYTELVSLNYSRKENYLSKDSIRANSIRIEKVKGKKTYTIHYTNDYTPNEGVIMQWYDVRESYIMDLVNNINTKHIK